ncbi:MAG TPA: hypothetical protein VFT64_03040 [Rickettsiales bacterium]|nr:hypothetical protein [Rickettsiales bacterium]
MVGVGLNLEETQWTNITIIEQNGKIISSPDLADIIYHIFRCSHAHCEAVPINYALIPSHDGNSKWIFAKGLLQMPDRIIWALLAVAVFASANKGIQNNGDYYLSWGSETLGLGVQKFVINEWWGREDDFRAFITPYNTLRVKMDKLHEFN